MAETLGSLIDKICIAELKIYHMQEQVDRPDAGPDHRAKCSDRVKILTVQRNDLAAELSGLMDLWSKGKWIPKVYRQFKMYNDPTYKRPPETARVR
jgi:hypothetical protein